MKTSAVAIGGLKAWQQPQAERASSGELWRSGSSSEVVAGACLARFGQQLSVTTADSEKAAATLPKASSVAQGLATKTSNTAKIRVKRERGAHRFGEGVTGAAM